MATAEDARIRLGGGPVERHMPECEDVDERIRRSKEYIKFHRDRKSGAIQKQMQEIRESQKEWRAQVESLVKAEIEAEARRH